MTFKIFLALALFVAFVLSVPHVQSFGIQPILPSSPGQLQLQKDTVLFSSPEAEEEAPKSDDEKKQELILDASKIQERMAKLKNKYPTAEADYLAAARKRAEMKVESVNHAATDDDWKRVANEKQKDVEDGGVAATEDDDWEASKKEEGNEDSQILIPVDLDGDDNDEPKLLL